MRFQAWHIIVLVIVILLVFGSAKLPDIASSIGKSLKVFKKEITELKEDTDTSGSGSADHTDVNPDGTPRT